MQFSIHYSEFSIHYFFLPMRCHGELFLMTRTVPQSRSSAQRAYTLVELVIVLAILVAMWWIAAPRYNSSICRSRSEQAARRIAADLNLARAQAVSSSAPVSLVFNVSSSSYSIAGVTGLDNKSTSYNVNLSADPYDCTIVSASFNSTQQVTFDRYGSADNAGQVIVQCGGIQTSVTLESSAGKATVP